MPNYDRDILNAAKMATFDRAPSSDMAKAWVSAIVDTTLAHEAIHHPRKRARKKADIPSFEGAVGAFAFDLLRQSANQASQGFMYRSSDRTDNGASLVSSVYFDQLVLFWPEMGLMDRTGYIDAKHDFDGGEIPLYRRARRFRATAQFLALALEHGLTPETVKEHFDVSHRHANVVQVRATKGADPSNPTKGNMIKQKGAAFEAECERVRRLNKYMAEHDYSLSDVPMLRRVFNCGDRPDFDFNLGGRFVCSSEDNWMGVKKEERALIQIDGQETVEIDVRASHLSILYGWCGQRLSNNEDPYAVGEYPRVIVKKIIVAAIGGGKMPRRWPKGFKDELETEHGLNPKHYKLKDVNEAILARHPVLNQLKKGKLDWANLQFEEAECFMSAMMELHEQYGIPSLPIHDSLIVRTGDVGKSVDILRGAYRSRLGFEPTITLPFKPMARDAA